MEESIKVYIKIDGNNCVVDCNSSIFWKDVTGCIQIDAWSDGQSWDRFTLAQNLYFDKPLEVQPGIYRYKYVDGVVSERTEEEIQADIAKIIVPISETELLKAQVQALTERNDFLEGCVAEIAMKVY